MLPIFRVHLITVFSSHAFQEFPFVIGPTIQRLDVDVKPDGGSCPDDVTDESR